MRPFQHSTLIAALGAVVSLFTTVQTARAIEDTIVYLECTVGDKTSRGTGVIVSSRGHVLTAKHVIPDGATCRGSIGVADGNNAARMVVRPTNAPVDAALLQFSQNKDYAFAGYCRLEDWMIRERILIAGYPGRTQTGVPSYREGILSTVFANGQGILETDAQSVAGMSGGPVYSKNLNGIVGIVIGAQFTPQGTPEYYGILPVETVASLFGVQEATKPCYHQTNEVDFVGPDGKWKATWQAGDGPVALNVAQDEAFCFIVSIFGEFNDPRDMVWVEASDDTFILRGENYNDGSHGAEAACVWKD